MGISVPRPAGDWTAALPDPGACTPAIVQENADTTVMGPAGPIAGARLSEDGDDVRIQFWIGSDARRDVPRDLARAVVRHRALAPGRPVHAAFPCGRPDILDVLRTRVRDTRVHTAGTTCLLDGWVR